MLQNQFIRSIYILLFFFLFQSAFSQQIGADAELHTDKKNAIKGLAIYLGPVVYGILNLSAGYERHISTHSIIELGGYYFNFQDDLEVNLEDICLMSGYKYVIISDKKMFNNTWYSAYLVYFKQNWYPTSDYNSGQDPEITYLNGIGCAMGRKMYFSKSKNWFVEIGFGISFNIFDIKPISPHLCNPIAFLPRPIIQIGGRF